MNYKFELTEQEANIVLQSLAKQPFEVVSPIINKIQFQAAQQQQAIKDAELAPKAKTEKPEKPLPELKKKGIISNTMDKERLIKLLKAMKQHGVDNYNAIRHNKSDKLNARGLLGEEMAYNTIILYLTDDEIAKNLEEIYLKP